MTQRIMFFQDAKAGTNNNKKYDVTQVRSNDGKNLSETISHRQSIKK